MRANRQFICGEFQPLTTAAILTVRRNLFKAGKTIIYVRPRERGPEAPFSFEEIEAMWEEAFPTMVSAGIIEIVQTDDKVPTGERELSWNQDTEKEARSNLRYNNLIWPLEIPNSVRLAINSFTDEWRGAMEVVP